MSETDINERFRYIRKDLGLSMVAFGRPIGMTLSEVKNIEYGVTKIRDDKIPLICNQYKINERWLRYGSGPKYVERSVGDEVGEIAARAAHGNPEAARTFFRNMYNDLGEAKFMLLYEMLRNILPQYDTPAGTEAEQFAQGVTAGVNGAMQYLAENGYLKKSEQDPDKDEG